MACRKEKNIEPVDPAPTIAGTAQSMYNDVFWEFEIYSTEMIGFPKRYILVFNHLNEYNELRGQFYVNNISLKIGTSFLSELQLADIDNDTTKLHSDFFTLLSDGDVIGDRYVPLSDSSMVFTVDQVKAGNQISGRFWGKMVKKIGETEYDPASPDTITFSEGTYEVKLE